MDDEMLMKPQIEFRESRSSSTSSGSSVTSLSSSSGVSSLGSSSSGGGGIHYYSQFEQSVLRSYGVQSGVNPALLAAASIAAAATVSGRESSPELQSNRSPSPPELTFTISHHPQQQQHQEMLNGGRLTPTESMTQEMQQQPIDMMIQQQQQPPMAHQQHLQQQQQLSPVNSNAFAYEPLSIMKHHGYFAPASQVTEFRSSSDIVRQVEAAIAGTENLLTPPRSSPESPDRSSSPESDSAVLMANRDNNTLPPRKRRLYFKDQPGHQGGHHLHQQLQQGEHPAAPAEAPVVRMSSVIQFAKAS